MADDNKNDDFDNEFDEEFDFESDDSLEDVSLESSEIGIDDETEQENSEEALDSSKVDESPVSKPQGKSSFIPSLIGLAIIGFVGYQLYNFFGFGSNSDSSSSESVALQTSPANKTQTSLSLDAPLKPLSKPSAPPADNADTPLSKPNIDSLSTPDSLEAEITPTPKVKQEPESRLANIPSWEEKPKAPEQKTPQKNTSTLSLDSLSQPSQRETQAIEKIETKLNSLQEAHQKQIVQIEQGLRQTTQNTNNLNKGVQALQQQIATLSQSVQQLSNQVNQLSIEAQKKPAPRETKAVTASREAKPVKRVDGNPKYTVYAIIPGRAWLRSTSGKTLTVSEGDQVDEYGKVLKIDPSNGIVVTSSGVTLR